MLWIHSKEINGLTNNYMKNDLIYRFNGFWPSFAVLIEWIDSKWTLEYIVPEAYVVPEDYSVPEASLSYTSTPKNTVKMSWRRDHGAGAEMASSWISTLLQCPFP